MSKTDTPGPTTFRSGRTFGRVTSTPGSVPLLTSHNSQTHFTNDTVIFWYVRNYMYRIYAPNLMCTRLYVQAGWLSSPCVAPWGSMNVKIKIKWYRLIHNGASSVSTMVHQVCLSSVISVEAGLPTHPTAAPTDPSASPACPLDSNPKLFTNHSQTTHTVVTNSRRGPLLVRPVVALRANPNARIYVEANPPTDPTASFARLLVRLNVSSSLVQWRTLTKLKAQ